MSQRNISHLGRPPLRYRVDRGATARLCKFETVGDSGAEDLLRARELRRAAKKYPELIDGEAAEALAEKLEAAENGEEVPQTLASSVYMRGQRINVSGALWQLIRGSER